MRTWGIRLVILPARFGFADADGTPYNFYAHPLKESTMQTAPATHGHATVKQRSKPATVPKEKFLGQLNPKLRGTVEALQKLYRKK